VRKLLRRLRHIYGAEDALTAIEYAVVLALIVTVCANSARTVGCQANKTFERAAKATTGDTSTSRTK